MSSSETAERLAPEYRKKADAELLAILQNKSQYMNQGDHIAAKMVLHERELEREQKKQADEKQRHDHATDLNYKILHWTKVAAIAAILGVVVGIVALAIPIFAPPKEPSALPASSPLVTTPKPVLSGSNDISTPSAAQSATTTPLPKRQ